LTGYKAHILSSIAVVALILTGCERNRRDSAVATAGETILSEQQLEYLLPEGFRLEMTEEVFRFVENWADEAILAEAALDLDLHENPKVAYRLEETRRMILASAFEQSVIMDRVNVDSVKIYKYYTDNIDEFIRKRDEVRCEHIMLADSSEAEFIHELLDSLSFEEIAAQFSHDPENLDIGYLAKDEMHPKLAQAAFGLREGDFIGPIKTEFGFHYIKLIDFAPKGSLREFVDVRDVLEDIITEREFQKAYQEVLDSLRCEKIVSVDSAIVKENLSGNEN